MYICIIYIRINVYIYTSLSSIRGIYDCVFHNLSNAFIDGGLHVVWLMIN